MDLRRLLLALLLISLLLVSGCAEKKDTGQTPKQDDTIKLKVKTHCLDLTPNTFCSDQKPKQCIDGELIDNCEKCGCQENQNCESGLCVETCTLKCDSTCGGEDNSCGGTCPLNNDVSCGENKICQSGKCIELVQPEKCDSIECKTLIVKVLDESGKPLQGAEISLYNSDTSFLTYYSSQITNEQGLAEFFDIESGKYYAFARKGTSSGKSESQEFKSGYKNSEYTVTVLLSSGTLKVSTQDLYNSKISFATVEIFDASNNSEIGSGLTDESGNYTVALPSGLTVYLIVSKENYSGYISSLLQISESLVTSINPIIEPEIIGKNIEVKFLGLFAGKTSVSVLQPGQEYEAKFQLRIPKKNYLETGLHIRAGSSKLMEKDPLFIKDVLVPSANVIKGTVYDEDSGLDAEGYGLTLGDAKWFNASYKKPVSGVYEISAILKVKESAKIGEELSLDYRAWGESGFRERHPVDDVKESKEFYSNTFRKAFSLGTETLCDTEFCFNVSVVDLTQDLSEPVLDSYKARIFNDYELRFELINNSKTQIHDNANLRINNTGETLLVTDYEFFDSESQPIRGTVNGFEFGRQDVGNLSPGAKFTGSFKFTPQRSLSDILNFKLVSDQQIVFEKNISISTTASKQLSVTLSETELPANQDFNVTVFVKDTYSKLELENALVKLVDKFGNVFTAKSTDKAGTVIITIPARDSGTLFTIQVEKQDYDLGEAVIEIQ